MIHPQAVNATASRVLFLPACGVSARRFWVIIGRRARCVTASLKGR